MKVIATAKGADRIALREPGDVFDMPDGSKGSWFEPVADPTAEKSEDEPKKRGPKKD